MTKNKLKPLAVYYSGGAGGTFFALTLALASQETHGLSDTKTVQEIIGKNWNISSPGDWDASQEDYKYNFKPGTTEFPDITVLDNMKLPIVKYDDALKVHNDGTTSILLYTDTDTHIELMKFKKRAFYHNNHSGIVKIRAIVEHYTIIKAESWPPILKIGDLKLLDEDILLELHDDFNFPSKPWLKKSWETKFKIDETFVSENIPVIKRTNKNIINDVDYKFLLQDVIKTEFKCVTDALSLEWSSEVRDHVKMWVALHPEKIQKMFYKAI